MQISVYIENDGLHTECKQNYFLSILLYLLFNKKSDKNIFKKKNTFLIWKFLREREKFAVGLIVVSKNAS